MLLKLQVNSQNVQNTQWSKFFKFSKFFKCSKFKSCQITILKYSYDTKWCNHINSCHSKDFKLVLNPYDAIWYNHINLCQTWWQICCKSVQLVRGSSFRNDLLQNPYFNKAKTFNLSGKSRSVLTCIFGPPHESCCIIEGGGGPWGPDMPGCIKCGETWWGETCPFPPP